MNRAYHIIMSIILLCTMSATKARGGTAASPFSHPAMLHSQQDIEKVKALKGTTLIGNALSHLISSQYAQTSYMDNTSELKDGYLKRMDKDNWGPNGSKGQYADYNNYTAAMKDANAAYQLALRYVINGETAAADAAVKILNAWATNCKGVLKITGDNWVNDIPDPNEYLMTIQGHQFANAAELLRDYSGWAANDFSKFQQWMKSTFANLAKLFLDNHHGNQGTKHYWLNWDLAALTCYLSVGILCDDTNMTTFAIDYYKNFNSNETGGVRNAVPFVHNDTDSSEKLGQCQESGRDQGHSTLDVALLGTFCQMAKNIGDDLFAYDDYRALAMAEYVAKYNLPKAESYGKTSELTTDDFVYNNLPFTNYTAGKNNEYSHTAISNVDRGTLRPCWEIFHNYAKSKGLAAKYCGEWVELMRSKTGYGDGGAGDYGNTSGGFDQLGYGTLMYAPTTMDIPAVYCPELNAGYDDLNAAFTAIYNQNEKTEITLNLYKDVEISARLTLDNNNSITKISIIPQNDNITISRKSGFGKDKIMFLNNKSSATFIIGNSSHTLTVQGKESDIITAPVFCAERTATLSIENIIIRDFTFGTENGHIFKNKDDGANKFIMKNIEINHCKAYVGGALINNILTGTNRTDGIYLQDNVSFVNCSGINIQTTNRIRLGEVNGGDNPTFNTSSVISIKWTGTASTIGTSVIAKGAKKSALFDLVNEDLGFYASTDLKLTQAHTVTTLSNAKGAATVVLPFEANIPSDVKVYTLDSYSNNVINTTEITGKLSANTPVLINTEVEGGKYKFVSTAVDGNIATGSGNATNGLLTGVYSETTVTSGNYILASGNNGVGFYKSNGTNKVKANHAYLSLPQNNGNSGTASTPAFFSISFDDNGTTAIKEVNVDEHNVTNGIYNLNGVRVHNPTKKGIYIINGKKVIIR